MPDAQQQPADDKTAGRGIMRIGQRVGETLADESAPCTEQGFLFGQTFEYDARYANDRSEASTNDNGAATGHGEAS